MAMLKLDELFFALNLSLCRRRRFIVYSMQIMLTGDQPANVRTTMRTQALSRFRLRCVHGGILKEECFSRLPCIGANSTRRYGI